MGIANLGTGQTTTLPSNASVTVSYGSIFLAQLETMNNLAGMMDLSTAKDFDEIRHRIQDGKISGGIIIPSNFTREILSGRQRQIAVIADQSNPRYR